MDWVRLLEDHNIEYVSRGPNTKRGEVSVKCPWCGDDDPSQHLGISLTAERWGCLRDATHRGRQPTALIAKLLGMTTKHAHDVVSHYSRTDPNTLDEAIAMLSDEPEPAEQQVVKPVGKLLSEFQPIRPRGATARFWNYLEGRGFDDVHGLCDRYSLTCATTGRFKDRVIIPVHQRHRLIGWTGRALSDPVSAPRYLSEGPLKQTVYNEDELEWGGETLFVTEGPFDAIKLDFFGAAATCLFGATATTEQLAILARLSSHWDRMVILFDADAVGPSFHTSDWLNARNTIIGHLPDGVKDPGSLTREQIYSLMATYGGVDTGC